MLRGRAEESLAVDPRDYSLLRGQAMAAELAALDLLDRAFAERLPRSLRDRIAAYRDANAAGPWWPTTGEVIVAERPQTVHTEPAGPAGHRRLHHVDGPRSPFQAARAG